MLMMVTIRPEMLIGVKGSWKITAAAVIVMTSLKMPQIDSVMTEERFRRLWRVSLEPVHGL